MRKGSEAVKLFRGSVADTEVDFGVLMVKVERREWVKSGWQALKRGRAGEHGN